MKSAIRFFLVFVLMVFFISCKKDDPKTVECDPPCDEAACEECRDGECVVVCEEGEECIGGECVEPSTECDPPCSAAACEECRDGECVSICEEGEECIMGACIDPSAECDPPCNAEACELCINDECVVICEEGEECIGGECIDPSEICEPPCDAAACEECREGECAFICEEDEECIWGECVEPGVSRLFVADGTAVLIWDDAEDIDSDRTPDAALSGIDGNALGLALDGDRLFVGSSNSTTPVLIYDDASLIGHGETPDDNLNVAAFGDYPLSSINEMRVDEQERLWINSGFIRMFEGAQTLGSTSSSLAQYTHEWGPQIFSMVVDTAGDKLLGGQVSGAGVIAWNEPGSKSGETNEADWQLHAGISPASMAIHNDRLYVACWNPPYMQIWNNISTLSSSTAPDVTMESASDLDSAQHVSFRGDVMVVTVSNAPNTYKVNIYLNAGAIDGETSADFEITSEFMNLPRKALLDRRGNLFVMHGNGILIFGDATTSPYLKANLESDLSWPNDFVLMD